MTSLYIYLMASNLLQHQQKLAGSVHSCTDSGWDSCDAVWTARATVSTKKIIVSNLSGHNSILEWSYCVYELVGRSVCPVDFQCDLKITGRLSVPSRSRILFLHVPIFLFPCPGPFHTTYPQFSPHRIIESRIPTWGNTSSVSSSRPLSSWINDPVV